LKTRLCDYADMEITPKPGRQRQIDKTSNRNIVAMVLILVGVCVIVLSVVLRTEMPSDVMLGVVALGVVLIVLPVGTSSEPSSNSMRGKGKTARCVSRAPSSC
jgi:hypothetical protein